MGILGVANRELAPKALMAIGSAGAAARTAAWAAAGDHSPDHGIIAEFRPSRLGLHKLALIETEPEGERKEKRIREVYSVSGTLQEISAALCVPKSARPNLRIVEF
jgi:hypothetical protein